MSTSLVPTSADSILPIAKSLAESGYFSDAKGAAQAYVKVLAGAELGVPPFQAMNGIHVIAGKPVLGAGLIASIIKRSGKYDYRIRENTDLVCSIEFFQGAESLGTSTFTIEQAKKAGVKNLDKFPQNMLFARCISNGAKWFTPDVFGGSVYTEGEISPEYTAPVVDGVAELYEARVTNQPRQTKKELAETAKAGPRQLTQEEVDAANTAMDDLEKEADGATTPEEFQALRSAIANRPALKVLPPAEQKKLLMGLCEIAAEKGIDYDNESKTFSVRPEPATEVAQTTAE